MPRKRERYSRLDFRNDKLTKKAKTTVETGAGASVWLRLSIIIIILDQLSKWAILKWMNLYDSFALNDYLDITYLRNTGAAFSFLADASGWQRWFFIGLGIIVSVVIMVWLRQIKTRDERYVAVGLSLVLGGALGNVIDRAYHGYVVDFIHVHWQDAYFPAFNIADSAITVGAAFLILDVIFLSGKRQAT
jgi:signal peptidase II